MTALHQCEFAECLIAWPEVPVYRSQCWTSVNGSDVNIEQLYLEGLYDSLGDAAVDDGMVQARLYYFAKRLVRCVQEVSGDPERAALKAELLRLTVRPPDLNYKWRTLVPAVIGTEEQTPAAQERERAINAMLGVDEDYALGRAETDKISGVYQQYWLAHPQGKAASDAVHASQWLSKGAIFDTQMQCMLVLALMLFSSPGPRKKRKKRAELSVKSLDKASIDLTEWLDVLTDRLEILRMTRGERAERAGEDSVEEWWQNTVVGLFGMVSQEGILPQPAKAAKPTLKTIGGVLNTAPIPDPTHSVSTPLLHEQIAKQTLKIHPLAEREEDESAERSLLSLDRSARKRRKQQEEQMKATLNESPTMKRLRMSKQPASLSGPRRLFKSASSQSIFSGASAPKPAYVAPAVRPNLPRGDSMLASNKSLARRQVQLTAPTRVQEPTNVPIKASSFAARPLSRAASVSQLSNSSDPLSQPLSQSSQLFSQASQPSQSVSHASRSLSQPLVLDSQSASTLTVFGQSRTKRKPAAPVFLAPPTPVSHTKRMGRM